VLLVLLKMPGGFVGLHVGMCSGRRNEALLGIVAGRWDGG